jgi:Leucine-rich repeat (LRR) protein
LRRLPERLAELTGLTELRLDNNRLVELPEWLATLTNLTELRLGENRLESLPDWLGTFAKLDPDKVWGWTVEDHHAGRAHAVSV